VEGEDLGVEGRNGLGRKVGHERMGGREGRKGRGEMREGLEVCAPLITDT